MKFFLLPLLLFILYASAFGDSNALEDVWYKNYFTELKKSYDKRVLPPTSEGKPVKVKISMWILDISKVDDSDMDFTASFYFRQSWNDSRLQFYGKNDSIRLRNLDDIWTPDLFFIQEKEASLHTVPQPNIFVRISPTGEVLYSIRVSAKFFCQMDFSKFPHDVQKCKMSMESYGFNTNHVELQWYDGKKSIGASKDITLFNFEIVLQNLSVTHEFLTSGEYITLDVLFTFERKFGFFAIKLYVPFILLVLVSLLSVWIRAEERGIRLSLLVTILYLMVNIATEANSFIPPAPYTKGTDVWIGFCESFVFAIFLEFVIVTLIAGRNHNEVVESKGEILLNMESESKEQSLKSDSLKSPLSKFVNMFDARNGGNGKRHAYAYRIDKICRFVFPIIFIVFNVVYWSVYCCKSAE